MNSFKLSRRQWLAGSALGLAAALRADPLGMPIGCQTYPVRDALSKNFPETLKTLHDIGYRTIEMCSPPGYRTSGFGGLVDLTAAQIRKTIEDAGLRCESCHFTPAEFKNNLAERIQFAKDLGLQQMVLSTFNIPATAPLADWTRAAEDLNRAAVEVQKAGLRLGFHNHNFEFARIDGVLIYDHLMSKLDPKLVGMQFQVAVISIGFQAAEYLRKYSGRFLSLHLADWNEAEKKQVPVGSGVVNWKDLFAAAKSAGVRNYFVEMDMAAMQASVPYLRNLQV
jgi:sugar phosphate isomerase/epimerase